MQPQRLPDCHQGGLWATTCDMLRESNFNTAPRKTNQCGVELLSVLHRLALVMGTRQIPGQWVRVCGTRRVIVGSRLVINTGRKQRESDIAEQHQPGA